MMLYSLLISAAPKWPNKINLLLQVEVSVQRHQPAQSHAKRSVDLLIRSSKVLEFSLPGRESTWIHVGAETNII